MFLSLLVVLGAHAQTCPSMQGRWACHYKNRAGAPWEMTIVDQTRPGGPLILEITSALDGRAPVRFQADRQPTPAPEFFGRGTVTSEPYQAPVNARYPQPCGIVSHFDVVTPREGPTRVDQFLYPQGGGVVRIFRKLAPAGAGIPEVSCKPILR